MLLCFFTKRTALVLTSPHVQGVTEFNISTTWELTSKYCSALSSGQMTGPVKAARAPSTYVFKALRGDVLVADLLKQLSAGEWHAQGLSMHGA